MPPGPPPPPRRYGRSCRREAPGRRLHGRRRCRSCPSPRRCRLGGARGIVDAIPRHGHHLASLLQRTGDAQLLLGATLPEPLRAWSRGSRGPRRCRGARNRASRCGRARPASRATDMAVAGWSPVIMTTRIPALRQRATARGTSGRTGSAIPTRPRNSISASASRPSPEEHRLDLATGEGQHRRPSTASESAAARYTALLVLLGQRGRCVVLSNPLAQREDRLRGSPWRAPRRRHSRADAACSSAAAATRRGTRRPGVRIAPLGSRSTPPFVARTSRAPSVGSPLQRHLSSRSSTRASPHKAATRRSRRTSLSTRSEWSAIAGQDGPGRVVPEPV